MNWLFGRRRKRVLFKYAREAPRAPIPKAAPQHAREASRVPIPKAAPQLREIITLDIEGHEFIAYMDENNKHYYDLDGNRSPNIFNSEKETLANAREVVSTSQSIQEAMDISSGNTHEYMSYEIEVVQNGSIYSALITEIGTDYTQKVSGRPGKEAKTPEDALSMAYGYCGEDYKMQLINGKPNTFDEAVLACFKNHVTNEYFMNYLEWIENKDPRAYHKLKATEILYAQRVVDHMLEHMGWPTIREDDKPNSSLLRNPSEKIRLTAIKQDNSIKFIKDPTKEIQLTAIKQHGYVIDCIELAKYWCDGLIKNWRKTHPKSAQYKCNDANWKPDKVMPIFEKRGGFMRVEYKEDSLNK